MFHDGALQVYTGWTGAYNYHLFTPRSPSECPDLHVVCHEPNKDQA
jgi:hypothetical protein